MNGLDELSVSIGSLQAQVAESDRQRKAQFQKLDQIQEKLTEVSGQIKMLADQVSTVRKEMEEDIRPAVNDWRSTKTKGLAVLGFIALMGSGAGAAINQIFFPGQ